MASFSEKKRSLNLRAMGFCGADNSVDPAFLQLLSTKYSWVEWGILFRPGIKINLLLLFYHLIDICA
jgi:hypothetical protein